jgi:hypothetical protein
MSSPPQATSRNPPSPPCTIILQQYSGSGKSQRQPLAQLPICYDCMPSKLVTFGIYRLTITYQVPSTRWLTTLLVCYIFPAIHSSHILILSPPTVSLDRMHPLIRDEFTSDYGTVQTALRSGVFLSRTSKASHTWNLWLDFCTTHAIDPWFPHEADPIPYLQVLG